MSDNENDTRVAKLAARRRGERALWYATAKRVAPLVLFVVLAVMYSGHSEARAAEAPVTASESVAAPSLGVCEEWSNGVVFCYPSASPAGGEIVTSFDDATAEYADGWVYDPMQIPSWAPPVAAQPSSNEMRFV